jgi:RNA polymerase sigma-70 factor (ECF subfamily)
LVLYGRALGLSHGEAEDVLQDTFLALLRLETAPREPAHYCVRAFRNRALNLRRGLLRRLVRELESAAWFEGSAAEDPRERAAMEAMVRLPADQREVVVLKIWHGYTFDEIGELTGVSPNTAAGRYRYALERLRGVGETAPEPIGAGETVVEPRSRAARSGKRGRSTGESRESVSLWIQGGTYEPRNIIRGKTA